MPKKTFDKKIKLGDSTKSISIDVFGGSGHIDYSGFGYHEDKNKKSERRKRKQEEKRAKRGDFEE